MTYGKSAASDQLNLPFVHVPSYGPDFLSAPSNEAALAWLGRTPDWPQRRLALWGASGSGKTHLLHLWAGRHSAEVIAGPKLAAGPFETPLAIDDADKADPLALLHALNAAAEAARPVLLASRSAPARWVVALPDLESRLRAITAVEIGAPEETLLRALLARLLSDRQLAVAEPVQEYLLVRLPRTPAAVREAASRLDAAGVRPTKGLARTILAELGGLEAGTGSPANETSTDGQQRRSHDEAGVL